MDAVSSYGYGLGYIGGSTIPLVMSLVLILFGESFGVPGDLACQISFMITAIWWLVFTIPMWKNVHQVHNVEPEGNLLRQTMRRMGSVLSRLCKSKGLIFFLLAYFFYIDGVGTIIHMATVFGETMGLDSNALVVILLVVQVVAFPCAIAYGELAKKYGVRNMILFGVGTYMLVCFVALALEPLRQISSGALMGGFILLAMLVGTAQGGIQALSRSYFGKLIPAESSNEFFGFFDIFGKFSAVVGPALFSLVWDATNQVQLGILPVLLMFVVGFVLFLCVPRSMEKIK